MSASGTTAGGPSWNRTWVFDYRWSRHLELLRLKVNYKALVESALMAFVERHTSTLLNGLEASGDHLSVHGRVERHDNGISWIYLSATNLGCAPKSSGR